MQTSTRIAAVVAGLTLSIGSFGIASADTDTAPAPCAQQQKQVDKAEDALARVTAVFAKQQDKVVKADPSDKASAKADRDKTKKAKKAQVQRLAKAEARLEACTAAQPPAA